MAPGSELRFSMGGEAYILGLELGIIMGIIWLFVIYLCVDMLIGIWLVVTWWDDYGINGCDGLMGPGE